jgi:CSLREA domain-containing protein
MNSMRPLTLSVVSAIALTLMATTAAGTVTVLNTNDSGPDSLRAAVAAASPGETIVFDASLAGQTITLTSGEIVILKGLTIDGGGNRITISGNDASRIFVVTPVTLTLNALTITDGNDGGGGGGGIVNGGTLTMNDSTVASCVASAAGAGILNLGTLTMNRCTVEGNVTTGLGGGIHNLNSFAHLTMTNCTVSGNVAASGNGGGVANVGAGATASLTYCTVTYNTSSGAGGGVHGSDGDANAVTLEASILAMNQGSASPDCSGTLVSNGSNVFSSTAGCTLTGTSAGNVVADPRLGSLQRNGGKTRTHALQPGSPAIDSVLAGSCGIGLTDQRELVRPQDGDRSGTSVCDAGAYEAVKPIVVTSLADPGDGGTCTLRQAIAAANTNSPQGACPQGFIDSTLPDRITFGVTGTITLTAGQLLATESLLIDGPGASLLVVNANQSSRVLELTESAAGTYVVSGVTLELGRASFGAGLDYYSTQRGTLAVDRTYFKDDFIPNVLAPGAGASLYVNYAAGVDIGRCTFVNLAAQSNYALLYLGNTSARITNSTVDESEGYIGIVIASGTDPVAPPGPLAARKTDAVLQNCTVRGSTYGISGRNFFGPGVGVRYRGCIHGHSAVASFFDSVDAPYTSLGDNVRYDTTGGPAATGDVLSTDALLGSLAYNGGQTPTIDTKPASPAIGHIPSARMRSTTDQRGFPRKLAGSDAGAVERVVGGDVNGDGAVNVSDIFYLINFLFAGGPVPIGEADMNGDGAVNVSDVFYLINTLFAGGPAPV